MTDTIKPNGDRDRPSDREAAKNPRGEGNHACTCGKSWSDHAEEAFRFVTERSAELNRRLP
jgi:hypothetical protein